MPAELGAPGGTAPIEANRIKVRPCSRLPLKRSTRAPRGHRQCFEWLALHHGFGAPGSDDPISPAV